MPLIVDIKPLRPADYAVAHRVFRDVRDWGHSAFMYPSMAPSPDISLTVWYEDETGTQINYQSDYAEFMTTIEDLRLRLRSETLPHVKPRIKKIDAPPAS